MSDRRRTSSARGDEAVREWALELDGVEPARAVRRAGAAAARGAARRSPTACAAGTRRSGRATSRSRSSPASCSSGAGCRSRTVGVYVPRNLVSTLVMCAVPAQVAGVERIVVCTPPAGAGLVAAAAEALGVDEVWALGGPQAIGWLAYVRARRQDRRARERVRERGEARGVARRRDRPARRAVRGRRRRVDGDVDPRIVELELAAQAEHGAGHASAASSTTLEEAEALAPEHLVLLGARPRRARGEVRNAGAVFVGAVVAGRRRRLRDRRQPRAADRRLGAHRSAGSGSRRSSSR